MRPSCRRTCSTRNGNLTSNEGADDSDSSGCDGATLGGTLRFTCPPQSSPHVLRALGGALGEFSQRDLMHFGEAPAVPTPATKPRQLIQMRARAIASR